MTELVSVDVECAERREQLRAEVRARAAAMDARRAEVAEQRAAEKAREDALDSKGRWALVRAKHRRADRATDRALDALLKAGMPPGCADPFGWAERFVQDAMKARELIGNACELADEAGGYHGWAVNRDKQEA